MSESSSPFGKPNRRFVVAYLSDRMPVSGPGTLFRQLSDVQEVARRGGTGIDQLVVDSGSRTAIGGRGARLQSLLETASARRGTIVLITAGPGRLAYMANTPLATMLALLRAGIVLKDGTGELHPTETTLDAIETAWLACGRHGAEPRRDARRGRSSPKPAGRGPQPGGAHV